MKLPRIYQKNGAGMALIALIFDADGKRSPLNINDFKLLVPVYRKLEWMTADITDMALVVRIFFCAMRPVFF